MEAPPDQDVMAGYHSSSSTGYPAALLKRKRTKRPSLLPRAVAASSSTSSADAVSAATEEEEDMAHCLILLAQGRGLDSSSSPSPPPHPSPEKFTSRKFTETITTGGGKAGFYVYECKTCNKCFPSFQALGGHRASHKKPKLPPLTVAATSTADENIQIADSDRLDIGITNAFSSKSNATPPTGISNNKTRVHECSICGAEFSSGQALGGHMRRHRPIGAPQELKKERNVLSLDLNLPAPSDDNTLTAPSPVDAFSFSSKRPMVFSATSAALVDCHY